MWSCTACITDICVHGSFLHLMTSRKAMTSSPTLSRASTHMHQAIPGKMSHGSPDMRSAMLSERCLTAKSGFKNLLSAKSKTPSSSRPSSVLSSSLPWPSASSAPSPRATTSKLGNQGPGYLVNLLNPRPHPAISSQFPFWLCASCF